jgi:hypothetical protein
VTSSAATICQPRRVVADVLGWALAEFGAAKFDQRGRRHSAAILRSIADSFQKDLDVAAAACQPQEVQGAPATYYIATAFPACPDPSF